MGEFSWLRLATSVQRYRDRFVAILDRQLSQMPPNPPPSLRSSRSSLRETSDDTASRKSTRESRFPRRRNAILGLAEPLPNSADRSLRSDERGSSARSRPNQGRRQAP